LILPDEDEWRETLKDPKRIGNLNITKKLLTDDYAVLRFAAELVDQRVRSYIPSWDEVIACEESKAVLVAAKPKMCFFQPFGKALFDLIEASRHFSKEQVASSRLNVAAANAISILNYANVPLAGRDFSRAQLGILATAADERDWRGTHAFADLNCAILNACNLQSANLSGARLQESLLHFADMRGCNLSNVILGRGRTLQAHIGSVSCLALSSDGKTLFSGSWDKSICEWNVETGELKQTLQGHTDFVRSLVLSSDGKTLFSASQDTSIRKWNAETGALSQTLQGTSYGNCLALSSDGKTLFSSSQNNSICKWHEGPEGLVQLVQTFQGHTDSVLSLALSSDGKTLFSGSTDKSIRQ
jgi:WD40 repeat protein